MDIQERLQTRSSDLCQVLQIKHEQMAGCVARAKRKRALGPRMLPIIIRSLLAGCGRGIHSRVFLGGSLPPPVQCHSRTEMELTTLSFMVKAESSLPTTWTTRCSLCWRCICRGCYFGANYSKTDCFLIQRDSPT
jgi:hypothetical protein